MLSISSLRLVQSSVSPRSCRGQALYSSLSFGAGGALGTFISGFILEYAGGPAVFVGAGFVALAGLFVAWFGLPKDRTIGS